ncbi:hypothetical protein BDR05DRAFT_842769, partial [Suillus weaverae]
QQDWAIKLLVIEFTMNLTCSSATGYSPFLLNHGHLLAPFIWNTNSGYPGVRVYLQTMKDATMVAHDALIAAHVKSTMSTNQKWRESLFVEGDLIYL